ncbi:hypothetical protein [Enteractinococcus coprophilus]|uniref:hypothetical protein n=1 Tax=Enteractinococcus coprophilus TaxID=1027633 RepID=UPI003666EFE3
MTTEEEESCGWWQVGCHASEWVSDTADNAIGRFVEGLHDGVTTMLRLIGTWWVELGGPDFGTGAVTGLQENLRYFVWVFGILGFLYALGKLAITQDVRSGAMSVGAQIFRMIIAGSLYIIAVPLLVDAGDATATWLLDRAMDVEVEGDFSVLAGSSAALSANLGTAFLMFLLMLIGAIVNFIFMIFRDVMFLILVSFIVVLAAASGTEAGNEAWRRANGWLLALLLFKPVAGGIYALGFRLIREQDTDAATGGDAFMNGLVSSLTGLLVLVLAALVLPALIKFVAPVAAAGAGAFSGGAAIGAVAGVAAGAAVIAGSGGTGAAAMAGGGGTASGAGAAAGGGGGTSAAGAGANAAAGGGGAGGDDPGTGGGAAGSGSSSGASDSGSTESNSTGSSGDNSSESSALNDGAASHGAPVSTASSEGSTESASTSAGGAANVAGGSDGGSSSATSSSGNASKAVDAMQAYRAVDGAMPDQNQEENES